jgi:hypothetical protein
MTIFKFALTLLLLLLSAPRGLTEIIRVKKGAAGTGSGDSWTNAVPELRDALPLANPGDEIWVAQGTYKPTTQPDSSRSFQLRSGVSVFGGFAGTEILRSQRNPDPHTNATVLSGDILDNDSDQFESRDDNPQSLITARNLTEPVTLDGFTIRDGGTVTSSGTSGGGLSALEATLVLKNLHFTANHASGHGGGASFAKSHLSMVKIKCPG